MNNIDIFFSEEKGKNQRYLCEGVLGGVVWWRWMLMKVLVNNVTEAEDDEGYTRQLMSLIEDQSSLHFNLHFKGYNQGG